MIVIKIIIYMFIFLTTSSIGILKAKKYVYRVDELREIKTALNIFKTKLKYTYEPIPEVFKEIAETIHSNIGTVFKVAANFMKGETASTSWEKAIEATIFNINEEDKCILKSLGNLLGETDMPGQISQIELTEKFIDEQILKAERDRQKNEKLFRTLGMTAGLTIVIILL